MKIYLKFFTLMLCLSGCATVVGRSDFDQVTDSSQKRHRKCVVHVGKAVTSNDEVQITQINDSTQAYFEIDKLSILEKLKKSRCDEAEIEDFAQFTLSSGQIAKLNTEPSQKMSCNKKDSTCIGLYFFNDLLSSEKLIFQSTYFFFHILTAGLVPYYSDVTTKTIVSLQEPNSQAIHSKVIINRAPYWSWSPLIFHPKRLTPRLATERAHQKQLYESIVQGLNSLQ